MDTFTPLTATHTQNQRVMCRRTWQFYSENGLIYNTHSHFQPPFCKWQFFYSADENVSILVSAFELYTPPYKLQLKSGNISANHHHIPPTPESTRLLNYCLLRRRSKIYKIIILRHFTSYYNVKLFNYVLKKMMASIIIIIILSCTFRVMKWEK